MSPFYATPLTDFGYDTTDQQTVDPRFGTLADFDQLVRRCHELGLKVIVDQVYTYTSHLHPWFEQSRRRQGEKEDWYVWADPQADGSPPNNWQAIFGGPAWVWDVVRGQYYMTHFMPGMPHLNVQNPDVQEALLEIGRFWLERGVDGFRLDVINLAMVDPELRNNPPREVAAALVPADNQRWVYDRSLPDNFDFVRRIRKLVGDNRLLLGEVSDQDFMATAKAYSTGDDRLHSAYYLLGAATEKLSAITVRAELEAWNDDDSWPTWAFSNHDSVRAPTRCSGKSPSPEFAQLLVAALGMARGSILLYQGEELGLPDAEVPYECLRDPASRRFFPDYLQRDGARTPMVWEKEKPHGGFSTAAPWLPVPDAHLRHSVDAQETATDSTLALTRRLLALRRENDCLRTGDARFLDVPEPLLCFERIGQAETLVCIFNFSSQPCEGNLTELAAATVRLERRLTLDTDGTFSLAGYGFACLERSE